MQCFICAYPSTRQKCSQTLRRDTGKKISTIIIEMIGPTWIVNIDDDMDEICETCAVLIEDYHQLRIKINILRKLFLRQIGRTYTIERANSRHWPTKFDVDRVAQRAFYKINSIEYSCKHCVYKTPHPDCMAPHFLFHNRDYDISNEIDAIEDQEQQPLLEECVENTYDEKQNQECPIISTNNHKMIADKKFNETQRFKEDIEELIEINLKIEKLSEHGDENVMIDEDEGEEVEVLYDEHTLIKSEHIEILSDQCEQPTISQTFTEIEPLSLVDDTNNVNDDRINACGDMICLICQAIFSSSKDFIEHMKMDHLTCSHCDKVYKDQPSVSRHFKFVHEGIKLICDVCSISYKSKNGFLKHFKRHTGLTEEWQCPYCTRSFWEKTNYKNHVSQHTNTSNYVCNLCGKTFTSASTHRLHIRYHESRKPFKCKQCPKAYASASSLAIHRRQVHTGEFLYECEFCGKGFASKGTYKIHRIRHVPEYPYNCGHCNGKGFVKKRDFARHMKNFHNDDTYLTVKPPEYKIAIQPEIEI